MSYVLDSVNWQKLSGKVMQPVRTSKGNFPLPMSLSGFENISPDRPFFNSTHIFLLKFSILTCFHKIEDFKHFFNFISWRWPWNHWQCLTKISCYKIIAPPNRFWFFSRSFMVRSNASKDFLYAIVHSYNTINLHCCKTFAVVEFFDMLPVGVSLLCIFNGNILALNGLFDYLTTM